MKGEFAEVVQLNQRVAKGVSKTEFKDKSNVLDQVTQPFYRSNDKENKLTSKVHTEKAKNANYLSNKPQFTLVISTQKKKQRVSFHAAWDTIYSRDYIEYLRKKELDSIIGVDNLVSQTSNMSSNYPIFLDWLIEMQPTLKFSNNTIFLAGHIINRFLKSVVNSNSEFILLGLTSFYIASKYEDIPENCLSPSMIRSLAQEYGFTLEDINRNERNLVCTSDNFLMHVSPYTYVEKMLPLMTSEKNKKSLMSLLICTLYSHMFGAYQPSLIVFCILSVLNIHKVKSNYMDNNDDFELALEYLDLKLINEVDRQKILRLLMTVLAEQRRVPLPGIESKIGEYTNLIRGIRLQVVS